MPAEKWQQWMPLHIDRFTGSRQVQCLAPAGRAGYFYLLFAQWQSPDSTIPDDDEELAIASGLGDDVWASVKKVLLKQFPVISPGKRQNAVCLKEWQTALTKFETYHERASAGGRAKAQKSSPNPASVLLKQDSSRDEAVLDSARACTTTTTYTSTKEKQLPCAPADAGAAKETMKQQRNRIVQAVWEYYLARLDRGPDYTFSATRRKHAEKGYDALMHKARAIGIAEEERENQILEWFSTAIHRLEDSDYHNGRKGFAKKYNNFENLFRSATSTSPDHLTDFWLNDERFGGK